MRLQRLLAASLAVGLWLAPIVLGAEERVMPPPERALSAFAEDPARRFDFWIGDWDVNLRMLQGDLTFADSVRARARIYRILDGRAILELWDSDPIKGYSLRYYDPEVAGWVLWLDWPGENRSGVTGLQGGFRHGRGEFRSSYVNAEGERISQVYSFNDITPFSLRWDDRYSNNGGRSWRGSWIMEWTRRGVDPAWPIDPDAVPTFDDGSRCDAEAFRPYEAIVGRWEGAGATLEAFRILDGCAVMAFLEAGEQGGDEFLFLTYSGEAVGWEVDVLDDDPSRPMSRYWSTERWDRVVAQRPGEPQDEAEEPETLDWSVRDGVLTYRRGGRALVLDRRPR